jgi:cupin superfamily acireductone dioxygenase involved in methionine salvage
MSHQLNRAKRRKILDKVSMTIDRWDNVTTQIAELQTQLVDANAEIERLQQELADLKDLAYNRAPKLAAEEANKQIDPLKAEIERLRTELGYIANAKLQNFNHDDSDFRLWAQNRARHALNQQPGTLAVKKS